MDSNNETATQLPPQLSRIIAKSKRLLLVTQVGSGLLIVASLIGVLRIEDELRALFGIPALVGLVLLFVNAPAARKRLSRLKTLTQGEIALAFDDPLGRSILFTSAADLGFFRGARYYAYRSGINAWSRFDRIEYAGHYLKVHWRNYDSGSIGPNFRGERRWQSSETIALPRTISHSNAQDAVERINSILLEWNKNLAEPPSLSVGRLVVAATMLALLSIVALGSVAMMASACLHDERRCDFFGLTFLSLLSLFAGAVFVLYACRLFEKWKRKRAAG